MQLFGQTNLEDLLYLDEDSSWVFEFLVGSPRYSTPSQKFHEFWQIRTFFKLKCLGRYNFEISKIEFIPKFLNDMWKIHITCLPHYHAIWTIIILVVMGNHMLTIFERAYCAWCQCGSYTHVWSNAEAFDKSLPNLENCRISFCSYSSIQKTKIAHLTSKIVLFCYCESFL